MLHWPCADEENSQKADHTPKQKRHRSILFLFLFVSIEYIAFSRSQVAKGKAGDRDLKTPMYYCSYIQYFIFPGPKFQYYVIVRDCELNLFIYLCIVLRL